ncbi:ABC transporter ATP-binding protein [Geobacter grbiciae]|uniref:ABC transporter ATP-binding protein n=1 Tax=Geobacter grbiciae TaxID=155042 RepID=UPI001C02FAFE|nr:ABC transporter ATP-binding protein [Geobacter grbiciae]MBT1076698.1 ABC transporter ATP-binding protein [Geobacter grbiciae]
MTDNIEIDIANLGKTYRGKKHTIVQALKGLNIAIRKGEVFGFLGPNGAGKSTTIKILTGQIKRSEGSATIQGVPVENPVSRERLGYLPENPSFYDFLTAREYLRFVGNAYGMSTNAISCSTGEVLAKLELEHAADRPIRGYSKGMVQRLGLAQAMLADPELLILDEPMSGLDPLGRALVKDLIKELKQAGKTIFFSTHITADVEIVCDRVGILVGGELKALDRVENILDQGIDGYSLAFAASEERTIERLVAVDELKATLEHILAQGGRIERIEPLRRDLERYFLDVVKGTNHEHS